MTGAQRIASTPAPKDWQAAYGKLLTRYAKMKSIRDEKINKQARQIATLQKQVQMKANEEK